MPQQMGMSFTVVGGLVIGDIAVQAGIVSPIMVVVVGVTALGAFAIPNYEAAFVTRMIRFPMLLVTAILGIVGTLAFALLILARLHAQVVRRSVFDTVCARRLRGMERYVHPYARGHADGSSRHIWQSVWLVQPWTTQTYGEGISSIVIRQRNHQTYAILTFVALLGPSTMDWIPEWLANTARQ